jgi:serine/threonine-protein kinase
MENSVLGIRPGSVIQDTYRVTKLLGEGGMGATFSGINLATDHAVAIKVITPEFARNTQSADLFRREANLLRTVQNDAVVRYETTMMDKSGQLYLVMEYIQGKPLSHFLDRGASLAPLDVLKLGKRIFGGLAAIHKLGIVHRDVSPDNIMIPDEDILGAKLIDFGVASDTVGTEKSIIGSSFAGKISYASPEQLGIGTSQVSPAADVYSLGLVLMRIAGMEVPGAGAGLAAAIDARRADIAVTSSSPALQHVLREMLRADPKDRPANIAKLFDEAIAAPDGPQAAPKPIKPATKVPDMPLTMAAVSDDDRAGKSNTGLIVAGLVALAVLGGGAGWYFMAGPGSTTGGVAIDQAAIAREAVSAADPLIEVTGLIELGGSDNLNAAFGALMAMTRDQDQPGDLRGRSALMIAQMYDPQTYDAARSPFPSANPTAARRFYTEARDFGTDGAQAALDRLGE